MKKPQIPYRSGKYDYEHKFEDKCIDSKWYIHPEVVDEVVESSEDYLEEGKALPPYEEWWYDIEPYSLQDLLDLTTGIDPKNVIINIHRDRQIQDITVSTIHRTLANNEERKKLYDSEMKDYEERLVIYNKEKSEYDLWAAEQEIKKLEEQIQKLKK